MNLKNSITEPAFINAHHKYQIVWLNCETAGLLAAQGFENL